MEICHVHMEHSHDDMVKFCYFLGPISFLASFFSAQFQLIGYCFSDSRTYGGVVGTIEATKGDYPHKCFDGGGYMQNKGFPQLC